MPFLQGSCQYTLALLGCLWSLQISATQLPALVDSTWLAQHANSVVILDVRSRKDFLEAHWPKSRWAGFNELEWQTERYDLPGYLPDKDQLATLFGKLGLTCAETVVVIGSAAQSKKIAEASRVVWSLMISGFKQVALLDGGIESIERNKLSQNETVFAPSDCAIDFQTNLLADTNRVEDLIDNNQPVIDIRPTLYFEGYKRDPRVPQGGTIYDGVGIPPEKLLDMSSGIFLSKEQLRQAFKQYDIPTDGSLATFSDTGIWGALGWFVIHQILQNSKAQLYDGSMVEWIDRGGEVHDSTDDMGGPIG